MTQQINRRRKEGQEVRVRVTIKTTRVDVLLTLLPVPSNLKHLYTRVPERWAEYVFSDRVDTRLVPPRHGPASGARGAAWLWSLDEAAALPSGR